jgi:hypothetical protein
MRSRQAARLGCRRSSSRSAASCRPGHINPSGLSQEAQIELEPWQADDFIEIEPSDDLVVCDVSIDELDRVPGRISIRRPSRQAASSHPVRSIMTTILPATTEGRRGSADVSEGWADPRPR